MPWKCLGPQWPDTTHTRTWLLSVACACLAACTFATELTAAAAGTHAAQEAQYHSEQQQLSAQLTQEKSARQHAERCLADAQASHTRAVSNAARHLQVCVHLYST